MLINASKDDNKLVWQPEKLKEMDNRHKALAEALELSTSSQKHKKLLHDILVVTTPSSFSGYLAHFGWWLMGKCTRKLLRLTFVWSTSSGPSNLWCLAECIPFARYELTDKGWVAGRSWNLGMRRDIPYGATVHDSVTAMHKAGVLDRAQMPVEGPRRGRRSAWNLWGLLWRSDDRIKLV